MHAGRGWAADFSHLPPLLEFILGVKSSNLLVQIGKLRPRESGAGWLLAPCTLTFPQGHAAQRFSSPSLCQTLCPSSKKLGDLGQNPFSSLDGGFLIMSHSVGLTVDNVFIGWTDGRVDIT